MKNNNLAVRQAMLSAGITQRELADLLERDASTVSRMLEKELSREKQAVLVQLINAYAKLQEVGHEK